MSLDKAIKSGKEHRHPNTKQPGCRNHGSCAYCLSRRLYRTNKEREKTDQMRKDV